MIFDDDLIPRRRAPQRANNENVLNLLPQEPPPVHTTERYYSMHNPTVEAKKRSTGSMGVPRVKVDPKNFTRKQDRSLPPVKPFHYDDVVPRKPDVPLRTEEPIHGLKSNTDFVKLLSSVTYSVSVAPKKPVTREVHFTEKKGYGEVPKYLERVKAEIEQEKQTKEGIIQERAYQEYVASREPERMSEEERQALLAGLKKRWVDVKRQIGTISLHIDIESIRMRKEDMERELAEIENAMEKLSKKVVLVERP